MPEFDLILVLGRIKIVVIQNSSLISQRNITKVALVT